MKLKTFVDILRSGNLALGSKLSNLLTEDCTILEYTNESVLFSKGSKLVLAKFKNPLTESKMTASHVLDNEVIEISKKDLNESMRGSLHKVVECIVTENLVDAQEHLDEFCQTFYQMAVIKNRYSDTFTEEMVKNSNGYVVRQAAKKFIPAFKAEIFSTSVVESNDNEGEAASLMAIVESKLGSVLALGKNKVSVLVTDALLGNAVLAEELTNKLYLIAEELDSHTTAGELRDHKYDLEGGKFNDEDEEDVEDEDEHEIPSVPTEKENLGDEDESKEFTPFNPAMFSEDDIKQLHKTTLKSILLAMQDFVNEKAGSLEADNADIPADLGDQINADLEALDDEDVADDRLSEIEARWNPMISYFLDSSYHTPEDEFSDEDEVPLEDQIPEEPEESTAVDNVDPNAAPAEPAAGPGAVGAMAPPMPPAPAAPMM